MNSDLTQRRKEAQRPQRKAFPAFSLRSSRFFAPLRETPLL
jgi:hypothetical protein